MGLSLKLREAQRLLDKLGEMYNQIEYIGWTVSLGWIVDSAAQKE